VAKPSDRPVNPKFGLDCASQVIGAVVNPAKKGWFTVDHHTTEAIQSLLGPTVKRMRKYAGFWLAGRQRRSVLDSDAQARQLQIEAAAEALLTFLRMIQGRNRTFAEMSRDPSSQELFEVLTKGLAGRPEREEVYEIAQRYQHRVSSRLREQVKLEKPEQKP
jgi:hypothetical protein